MSVQGGAKKEPEARHGYNVGERIVHTSFGEGLIVEKRERPFYDVLEVVFRDGVRRLTSVHPDIRPAGAPAPDYVESPPAKEGAASSSGFSREEVVRLHPDSRKVVAAFKSRRGDELKFVRLHWQAEHLLLNRGFDRLICLDELREVKRYQHQIDACLRALRHMGGRALLADEVGLGKTIEAGMILKEYVLRGLVKRALVLVPASLTIQWKEELDVKFGLQFTIYDRRRPLDESPFVICSLDTAKTAVNRARISGQGYDIVIVDEAHRLRNQRTLGWKFANHLDAKYLLLLTATPVQNELRELFNLVTLLRPGSLGTYSSFRRAFTERGDKRLPKNTEELRSLLSEVMVRTSRSSTNIYFPKRNVETLHFDLNDNERDLYDSVSEFVHKIAWSDGEDIFRRWHFTLLTLQREIGSSSFAALRTLENIKDKPVYSDYGRDLSELHGMAAKIRANAKLDGLLDILSKLDERVIVFTQFKTTLDYLAKELIRRGIKVSCFHGDLTPAEKEAAIDRFRRGVKVLVSTEAGGEGRNLQFCRVVVNYDLPWNPMRIEQRIGRVHRLGQDRDIDVFNFTAGSTVESYVLEILQKKLNMFELVVGEMDMILGNVADTRSFEDKVFQIWATAKSEKELKRHFAQLGDELYFARRRYEKIKDLDEAIFGV
jgi:SNF2 family DNA or RNA helicase